MPSVSIWKDGHESDLEEGAGLSDTRSELEFVACLPDREEIRGFVNTVSIS